MAHSYTPGLKVLQSSTIKKERRLPIKGEVVKKQGDKVNAKNVVARTNLPGNVHMVKVSNRLNVSPADIKDVLLVKEGDEIKKGNMIAQTDGLFGFFKSEFLSPVSGTIESISDVTGQVVIRDAPIPVEVDAYLSGTVSEVIDSEGVIVEAKSAYVQGIFGIGGESEGKLKMLVDGRNDILREEAINDSHKGKIIVGGAFLSIDAYKKALSNKVAGIVVGGFNYYDLEEILGYTLGVAITGTENLATSLIVTEGYGSIPMSERTFNLLSSHDGSSVSVNGATQIRAGVIRPEIVIPLDDTQDKNNEVLNKEQLGIKKGSIVRVIRAPFFGKIGEVLELPAELQKMESETMVRVAKVKIDNQASVIPRSNLELLETD